MRSIRFVVTAGGIALAATAFAAIGLATTRPAPRNLERALTAQRSLVTERPTDAGARSDLGNLLTLAGDRRAAESAYLEAIALDPDHVGTRFNYGLLLTSTGRRLPALRQFRAVVDRDPGHAWAHYQLGLLYDSWGLDRMARRAYARAFRFDPTLADARVNPGVLDNGQATMAMLLAWKDGAHDSGAPRSYTEPARIAGLLIDVPERTAPDPNAGDELAEDASAESGGFARLASPGASSKSDLGDQGPSDGSYSGEDEAAGDDEESRVLTAGDLSGRRTVNQVTSDGAPAGRSSTIRRSSSSRRDDSRPPFFPDSDSTGRLELQLLPAEPGALVAG